MTNSGITDLISRAAALEVIEAVKNVSWSQSGKVLCSKMYSQIKDIPAVDEEQEPRVMTLEEVQSCENAMWIELLGGKGFYAFVLDRMKNGILEISTRAAYLRYYSKDYDATWRCWTSRPTDEQREKVKWE